MTTNITRRDFLRVSGYVAVGTVLVNCTPATDEIKPLPSPTTKPRELLTLRATTSQYGEKAAANANDIVTPYVEKMFNMKFDVFLMPQDTGAKDFYALNKAAGTLPDVMMSGRQETTALGRTGDFADLTDYLPMMPNYMRWVDEVNLRRFLTDGRQIGLPQPKPDTNGPEFEGNIFYQGYNQWPLLMREDILTRLGYKLTPIADIAKETTDNGVWPTFEQLAIEPAIDTPEAFDEFLKKVKAENIMVGDLPLTPLSSSAWSVFHLSSMMDNGHWRINDEGEVDGYLGLPGAYPYYKLWSDWYRNDLVDKDYVTHKDDQLQAKWAAGRVAAGLFVPNLSAARQALIDKDPTAMIRPVQWPKQDQRYGFFDIFETGGWTTIFNKEIEELDRVIELIDWLNSDEGIDVNTWGPEEAGLYVEQDGKKLWKDEETRMNIMDNIDGTKNADYYGVFSSKSQGGFFTSRVFYCMPMVIAPFRSDPRFNYEPQLDIFNVAPRVLGREVNMGLNTDSRAVAGDGGDNNAAVQDYFWASFVGGDIAKALTSKDDAEFDTAWEEIQANFDTNDQYSAAKSDMENWFAEFGPAT